MISVNTPLNKDNNQDLSKMSLCEEAGFHYDVEQRDTRTPDRQIKIALFPTLRAQFKDTRDGPWKTSVVLVKGNVHIWGEPKNLRDELKTIDDDESSTEKTAC